MKSFQLRPRLSSAAFECGGNRANAGATPPLQGSAVCYPPGALTHKRSRRFALPPHFSAVLALVLLGFTSMAGAATFVVDRTDEAGPGTCSAAPNDCTLIGAIAAANAAGSADTITFDPAVFAAPRKTLTISYPEQLVGTLSITAPAAGVEISGENLARPFIVTGGANVTMTGLTIRNGNAVDPPLYFDEFGPFGGGIFNQGTLLLDSCTLTANRAGAGGAIYSENSGSVLTIRNCTITGNTAEEGGAQYNQGGAILIESGVMVIESSTINGNSPGGIFSAAASRAR